MTIFENDESTPNNKGVVFQNYFVGENRPFDLGQSTVRRFGLPMYVGPPNVIVGPKVEPLSNILSSYY